MDRKFTLLTILAVLLVGTGVALGMSVASSEGVPIPGLVAWIISGGIVTQTVFIGIWVGKSGANIKANRKDLDRVIEQQSKCAWFNRSPKEFKKKNGD